MDLIKLKKGNELQAQKANLESQIEYLDRFVRGQDVAIIQTCGLEFIETDTQLIKEMLDLLTESKKKKIEEINQRFEQL